jgi:hypothetical protein
VSDEPRVREQRIDRRRVVLGGTAILGAVLGYAAVQAIITATALPDAWVVLVLPLFGVVGIAGLASFVSGALAGRRAEG